MKKVLFVLVMLFVIVLAGEGIHHYNGSICQYSFICLHFVIDLIAIASVVFASIVFGNMMKKVLEPESKAI